ncbi:hypothetical protein B0H16DRAFT_1487368 [Mycena metata]|uniref:Uncharacterized protein n=1 Tax=Mycena metata TaxID=1033252 RepID=A0AAD7DD96_9AGAR|nr:hypothetical protein B0H16DRAFT_1487368 [Mycena metata]
MLKVAVPSATTCPFLAFHPCQATVELQAISPRNTNSSPQFAPAITIPVAMLPNDTAAHNTELVFMSWKELIQPTRGTIPDRAEIAAGRTSPPSRATRHPWRAHPRTRIPAPARTPARTHRLCFVNVETIPPSRRVAANVLPVAQCLALRVAIQPTREAIARVDILHAVVYPLQMQ